MTKLTHKKMALTIDEIATVLKKKAGNMAETARALNVTRQAIHKRVSEDEALQAIVADAREAMVDVAESQALQQIKQGNTAMIIFTLKTLGKNRGYIERSEIDHRVKDVTELSDDELRAIVEAKSGSGA